MPLSVFRTLGLGEPKLSVSLQLADRSIKYPREVIEDVLVNIKNSTFRWTSSYSTWMSKEVPLILGRSFLASSKTLIDIQ